jgi:hypothetical protein
LKAERTNTCTFAIGASSAPLGALLDCLGPSQNDPTMRVVIAARAFGVEKV